MLTLLVGPSQTFLGYKQKEYFPTAWLAYQVRLGARKGRARLQPAKSSCGGARSGSARINERDAWAQVPRLPFPL